MPKIPQNILRTKMKVIRWIYLVETGLLLLSKRVRQKKVSNVLKKYQHIFTLFISEFERKYPKQRYRSSFYSDFPNSLLIDLHSIIFSLFEAEINEIFEKQLEIKKEKKKEIQLWKFNQIKKYLIGIEEIKIKEIQKEMSSSPPFEIKIDSLYKNQMKSFDIEKRKLFQISRTIRNKMTHTNKLYLTDFQQDHEKIIQKYMPILNGQIGYESLIKHFCFLRQIILNFDQIIDEVNNETI